MNPITLFLVVVLLVIGGLVAGAQQSRPWPRRSCSWPRSSRCR